MNLTGHLAKHLREVYFGENWTSVNLKDSVAGLGWQQATTKLHSFNTIAALVYHINYYVTAVSRVLLGEPLNAKDKYSFDHPPVQSQKDWEELLNKAFGDAENLVKLIELLPEFRLWEDFSDGKYGNYYRNIQGVIEHTHYHLGQIVLLRKLLPRS